MLGCFPRIEDRLLTSTMLGKIDEVEVHCINGRCCFAEFPSPKTEQEGSLETINATISLTISASLKYT